MKRLAAAIAAPLLLLSAGAEAATIYATAVDWANNGTIGSNNDRDNPANLLGAPDGAFASLGLSSPGNEGFAVFQFGQPIAGSASVVEVTFNCRLQQDGSCSYPEGVALYVGNDYNFGSHDFSDLSDFTYIGDLLNGDAQSGASLVIPGTFTYLALVDISSTLFPGGPSTDGFDVDAVSVNTDDLSAVPVPAAAFLMIPAVAGLAMRRRRSK